MSQGWPLVALRALLDPVRRPVTVELAEEYALLGVRLDGGGPFLRETKKGSELAARTLLQVKAGDFIYSRLFAWRGAFGIVPDALDGCFVSNEFPTFSTADGRIDLGFLNYWFQLPSVRRQVESECTGSTPLTRNRFKEEFFLQLQIPLPKLVDQQRIAGKIEQAAVKIGEARRLRRQAVAEAEALVTSLHLSLANGRMRRVGDVVELAEDAVSVVADREYPQVGLRSFGMGLFRKPAVRGSETTYKKFNRLYEGALVLSQVKGWEGAIDVCDAQLVGWFASPEYRTFKCIPSEARPNYLAAIVRTKWFRDNLQEATRGVGARRERTRPEQFITIEIPMPDVHEQERAEVVFRMLREIKELEDQTTSKLDALLPSVLDRAFEDLF